MRATQIDLNTALARGAIISIAVRLAEPTIDAGDTTIATATVHSTRRVKQDPTPRWSSSATSVAIVDSITGVVRAIAAGTAMIVATVDTVGGQALPTVKAPQPVEAARVIFHSDWSTATGTSQTALMDASKALPWSLLGGDGLEVIPSTGLNFPSANVLRVTATQARTGYAFLRKTGLAIPVIGESRYYRWYTRVAISDRRAPSDPETHPHQDGNAAGGANWLFHVYHDAGSGRWLPQLRSNAAVNAYPSTRWSGPLLSKNVTYRFELQIRRAGANTFQMHVRVYDAGGALIHSDADFRNEANRTLASTPTFTFVNLASMDGLNAGLNGLGGAEWFPSVIYMYQGGIAVCADGWCGPYSR